MIDDYASGRRFTPVERALFAAAARNDRVALRLEAYATRSVGPQALLSPRLGAAIAADQVRRALPRRTRHRAELEVAA